MTIAVGLFCGALASLLVTGAILGNRDRVDRLGPLDFPEIGGY